MQRLTWIFLFCSVAVFADDLSQESAFQLQAKMNIVNHRGSFEAYGVGLRYLHKPIEFSGFGFEPNFEVLSRPASKNFESATIYNIGLDGSFTLIRHSPWIGLFGSQSQQRTSPSMYDPDWGVRAGYRYFWKLHLFGLGWEWVRLRSHQADPEASATALSFVYAYTF